MSALKTNTLAFLSLLKSIPPDKQDHRYAEGKWTIKEVIQHIIDIERVFTYRALRFARKDPTNLPGFDEKVFSASANADKRKWEDIVDEFTSLRKATELMFGSFDDEQLESVGTASNVSMYVLGIGYIIVGHCEHHLAILKEKYLEKENQPA
jgi:uncharacterized damage-inducible protein DinB